MLLHRCLRSSELSISQFELPKMLNISLSYGNAKLCLAVLLFKYLKSVTDVLSLVTFLLINITGEEYAEKPSLIIPK